MSTKRLRRDHHWLLATARAMTLSLLVVAAAVVVVSGAFVAMHAQHFNKRDYFSITQCLVSQDGKRAIALWWTVPTSLKGWSHRVTLHQPGETKRSAPLTWPEFSPSCIAKSPTDDGLFAGGWDGSVVALSEVTQGAKPRWLGKHEDGVIELEASVDGRYLLSLSPKRLCAWNLMTNQLQWQGDGSQVSCFRVRPDSQRLLCGMVDGRVLELDLLTGERIRNLIADPPNWPVHDLELSPDGRWISVVHSTGEARLFSATETKADVPCPSPFCLAGWPRFARFSRCSTMLVTTHAGDEPILNVWNVASGEQVATLRGHAGIVLGAEFAPDGRLFSWGKEATIRVWDIERGQTLHVLSLAAPGDPPTHPQTIARPKANVQTARKLSYLS